MSDKKLKGIRVGISAVLILLFLGLGAWVILNRQYIVDQINVWNYQPSSEIATLTTDTTLTDKGTFYFYATEPRVENADQFNKSCPQQEVNNPILGCYTNQRIYIYDVENATLEGIKEVTAAHEMLHAAWDRLAASEKARLTKLLHAEYKRLDSGDLKNRMDYYQRTEPGEFYNELHSIVGTEIKVVSPDLETYYRHYFQNRQKIVEFHANYSEVFDKLEAKSKSLYDTLTSLDTRITTKRTAYNREFADLSKDINSFNQRAKNDEFSSREQQQAEYNALNARTIQLEAERVSLNSLIDQYNQTYSQYKIVASQIQQLNTSIDSMSDAPVIPSIN